MLVSNSTWSPWLTWGDLVPPGARLEDPLARAAAEVRAAYRQITHDTTTLATPEVIATRPGLPQATMATLRAIEAGSELAHVVAEKADAPNLTGPARAMSRRAHNDVEFGLATPPTEGDVVWVSPADILARRAVTVPRPVREALRSASTATASAASTAAASAVLALANRDGHRSTWLSPSQPAVPSAQEDGRPFSPSPGVEQCPKSTGCIDRRAPVRPLM